MPVGRTVMAASAWPAIAAVRPASRLVYAVDWSRGRYEEIAAGLLPAAQAVVHRASPRAGERVLDVGCGTGNGALLAAERGASVVGIDPAQRLLNVARARAQASGLEVKFIVGDAAALPIGDGVADLVISVFGVIFAPDASAAIGEMARVTDTQGRIVFCAWLPGGPISEVMRLRSDAITAATGKPAGRPPFAWHDPDVLRGVFSSFEFSVSLCEHTLAFEAQSPHEFIDSELRHHPAWIEARALLEPRDELRPLRDRAVEILEEANEAEGAFRVSSSYVIATALRSAASRSR